MHIYVDPCRHGATSHLYSATCVHGVAPGLRRGSFGSLVRAPHDDSGSEGYSHSGDFAVLHREIRAVNVGDAPAEVSSRELVFADELH